MNKEQAQKEINIIKERLAELEKIVNKPEKGIFRPKFGDLYYFVDTDGCVCSNFHDEDLVDKRTIDNSEVFRTEKEAEKHALKKRVHIKLLEMADGYEFESDKPNYYLFCCTDEQSLYSACRNHNKIANTVYFETNKKAQEAIDNLKQEEINAYFDLD